MKYLDITVEVLLNSLILSFVAAMIRVMFSKIDKYSDTLKIFIGSILFGVIIGYILNDFDILKPYLKGIIVVFGVFGKELFIWMEKIAINPGKNIGMIVALINGIRSIKIGITSKTEKDDVD